jgi:hypothetical protein
MWEHLTMTLVLRVRIGAICFYADSLPSIMGTIELGTPPTRGNRAQVKRGSAECQNLYIGSGSSAHYPHVGQHHVSAASLGRGSPAQSGPKQGSHSPAWAVAQIRSPITITTTITIIWSWGLLFLLLVPRNDDKAIVKSSTVLVLQAPNPFQSFLARNLGLHTRNTVASSQELIVPSA